jgi:hypothetical protein
MNIGEIVNLEPGLELKDVIPTLLEARGTRYGEFPTCSVLSQRLKGSLESHPNYAILPAPLRESLELICMKMARIVNGDPTYIDNWVDIQGYAKLIEVYLQERV